MGRCLGVKRFFPPEAPVECRAKKTPEYARACCKSEDYCNRRLLQDYNYSLNSTKPPGKVLPQSQANFLMV